MEQLKDILSDKQLEQFEDVFYSAEWVHIKKKGFREWVISICKDTMIQ